MEIGLAIGGAFLSSGLNVLFDRLAPHGELLKMFHKAGKDDHLHLLDKLEMTLLGLQAVLTDAENKKASNPYVSRWINKLQHAVDSAENLMEHVNYEALRLKVESQHQVSDPNLCLSDEFFLNIKEKLEDTVETLEGLEKQIGRLDLNKYLDSGKQEVRKPSTSVVDESDIFGRQDEIRELVELLVSIDANENRLTVIPIVGMAGVGKTTLAKAVYNDEKVKTYFELKAWICISESYDALGIIKGILQEIGSFDSMADNNLTLNQLQIKLKEFLKGKTFLIVLDDLWNDSYSEWDELRSLFVQGKEQSKIIVTTRNERIALMMRSEPIILKTLSTENSWPLFERHAFENMDPKEYPELVEVGKKIADKCKGLPLALKTLAGVLRSKSEVDQWRDILRSETWELPSHLNGILPALMLSYIDLPGQLKRCFAYCAIFPKDYPFRQEEVIQLWIANGLAERSHKDETLEHSGNRCFHDLRSRSLFERVPMPSPKNIVKFVMHDLVNDLAQIASSGQCVRLEDNEGSHMLEQTRHLSYLKGDSDFEKLKPLAKSEQLRTLIPIKGFSYGLSKRVLHNILPTLTSLRALSLSGYDIEELPDDLFITLRLLRFLDISCTEITKLPDSICALYNLETLLLSSCDNLEELPLQMEKLINLRHLDIRNTPRLKMQLHLSKLKSLCVLLGANFFLGGGNGDLRIGELGEVHNLYGSLSIKKLQNVTDRMEAMKAKMREKEHVEKLTLEWSGSEADNSQEERDILDELQPSTNIKELQLWGYRGTRFPDWLGDDRFCKLVRLRLENCKYCYSLPALGQLPSLKKLFIEEMHQIVEVAEGFYGSPSSIKPFNSLERLEIGKMREWKRWGNGEFPALQYLSLSHCPKLTGKLPKNLCSLTELTISKCPELIVETPIRLSCLKVLNVVGSTKVGVLFDDAELFASQLQGMKQIESLYLKDCEAFASFPFSILPNTLKRVIFVRCQKLKLETLVSEMISSEYSMFLEELKLEGCDSIDIISPEFVPRVRTLRVEKCQGLTRLLIPTETETLEIRGCQNLEILSVASGIQTTSLLKLDIYDCEKMKSLPERMQELLPSLNRLVLYSCPEIESFPEGGLPFSLEVLRIESCWKLLNGRKEWRLQRLPCLNYLSVYGDRTDEEFDWELPASIRKLMIPNLKTLSSQLLKSLTSLTIDKGSCAQFQFLEFSVLNYLEIIGCDDQILSLPESASLSKLVIKECHNIQSLPAGGLQRLTSLRLLEICGCNQLQSLAELVLPSSLSELIIWDCPNLKSLAESVLPSSLSELIIWRCPNLKYLPVKGMPSSISSLHISECPLLKPSVEFEKGDYWPKIAHIPTIEIDWYEYQ